MQIESFERRLMGLLYPSIESKKIGLWDYHYNPPLEKDNLNLERLNRVHSSLNQLYYFGGNGFELTWSKSKKSNNQIGGQLKFLTAQDLAATINIFYNLGLTEQDYENNPNLEYYYILDLCTPETSSGFIIKGENIAPTMYYTNSDMELYPLDLDYHGYTEMAVEARVFYYWQLVLLHYAGITKLGEEETNAFKKHMSEIFPDFSWEKFITKYESLRLSNQ